MNGLIKINVAGKSLQMTFGMMAVEEIGSRQLNGTPGWCKLITDIIYGGYVNDQYLEGKAPEYSYRQISEMVDELIQTQDGQLEAVFTCFGASKAGAGLADVVKKKASEVVKVEKQKKVLNGTK